MVKICFIQSQITIYQSLLKLNRLFNFNCIKILDYKFIIIYIYINASH